MTMKWEKIGGNKENPGVFDSGIGSIVTVARQGSIIRRVSRSYCGRSRDNWTLYTNNTRDDGGVYVPEGVDSFSTLAAAKRA